MPCPDRNNDARIIAEIERRKRLKKEAEDYVLSITPQSITWEGSLRDIEVMGIDESKIISIEQMNPGTWLVTYNDHLN